MNKVNSKPIKVSIHPLFFAFAILLIIIGEYIVFLNYMAALLLHEYAHAYIAKLKGYEIRNIKVMPFGIALNLHSKDLYPKDEVAIAIAGPCANLVLIIISMALWWIFPSTYQILNIFVFANAVTLVFNLLPILPLDGGRVVVGLLSSVWDRKKICKVCFIFNIIVGLCLFAMFINSIFTAINFTYLFMSIFVVVAGLPSKQPLNYNFIDANMYPNKHNNNRTKIMVIEDSQPLYNYTSLYHLTII